jgi:hypothetical protein
MCADAECSGIEGLPVPYGRSGQLFSETLYRGGFGTGRGEERVDAYDYGEDDAVFGASRKVEAALRCLDNNIAGKTVTIRNQCTPLVMGEDFESLVVRLSAGGRNEYRYSTMHDDFSDKLALDYLEKKLFRSRVLRGRRLHIWSFTR